MHVVSLLKSTMFDIEMEGRQASIAEVFPDWHAHDRFGLVIDQPFGGIGASHLLQAAMMAYCDIKPSRRTSLAVYPQIYAFHIGKGHGAHAPYDFWPARREVILRTDDPREILDAINDRGITRLAVPDRPMRDVVHRPKEEDAAFDRIAPAFVYDAGGRVNAPDLRIGGNDRRTEYNADEALKPVDRSLERKPVASGRPIKETEDSYFRWLLERDGDVTQAERQEATARRRGVRVDGLVMESYRRVGVAEALKRLASAGL